MTVRTDILIAISLWPVRYIVSVSIDFFTRNFYVFCSLFGQESIYNASISLVEIYFIVKIDSRKSKGLGYVESSKECQKTFATFWLHAVKLYNVQCNSILCFFLYLSWLSISIFSFLLFNKTPLVLRRIYASQSGLFFVDKDETCTYWIFSINFYWFVDVFDL